MPQNHPLVSAPRALNRADLLDVTLHALDEARALDRRAKHHPTKHNEVSPRTVRLRAHLDAQRHLVARRAAHVALTPGCTDVEREFLRAATGRLVAISGALSRHLGDVGWLN